jgi:hypothetical protein
MVRDGGGSKVVWVQRDACGWWRAGLQPRNRISPQLSSLDAESMYSVNVPSLVSGVCVGRDGLHGHGVERKTQQSGGCCA